MVNIRCLTPHFGRWDENNKAEVSFHNCSFVALWNFDWIRQFIAVSSVELSLQIVINCIEGFPFFSAQGALFLLKFIAL